MEVERAGGVVQTTCASTRMAARCSHFAAVGLQPHGPEPWLALIAMQRVVGSVEVEDNLCWRRPMRIEE